MPAGLLSMLAGLGRAGIAADTGAMQGAAVKRDREQRDLLAQLAQQRQADADAQERERTTLLNELTKAQTAKALAEPNPPARRTQYDPDRGGVVDLDNNTFTPTPGLPAAAPKPDNPMLAITKEQQRFQREQSLADDFRQEQGIKDASGVAGAVATIRGALSTPTPQGDLAAIYALVKLYDPGSVVREGEISLTQGAASLPEQVRRLWAGWNTGRKLTDKMKADIAEVANSVVAERQFQVDPILARYGERSRQWGADSAAVAPNPLQGARIQLPDQADPEVEALIRRPGRGPTFPGARP